MAQLTSYNVIRDRDRAAMLDSIGVATMDELLDFIPAGIRLQML